MFPAVGNPCYILKMRNLTRMSLTQFHTDKILMDNIEKKEEMKKRQEILMKKGLPKKKSVEGVANVFLVSSGKGGVGKSTTAVNLAVALNQVEPSLKVGLLDSDVFGPSLPVMMGVSEQPFLNSKDKMMPVQNYGISCMSIGLLVDPEAAVVWRGPMVMGALNKLVHGTDWTGTDILIVDTPPGTGDIHLSLSQTVEINGAIIVSTPQKVALVDAKKGVDMFNKVGIPVLGVVQNMSSFICGSCQSITHIFGNDGALDLATNLEVPLLGSIPLDPLLMYSSDSGKPLVLSHPNSIASGIFRDIAGEILNKCNV